MARLPQPGGDANNWGQILNEYLSQTHDATGQLKSGVVSATNIADGAITPAKLNTEVQNQIAAGGTGVITLSGAVFGQSTATVIANNAVTARQLTDNAVTSAKIAAGAVGTSQLADSSVNSAKIADGSVAENDLTPVLQNKINDKANAAEVYTRTQADARYVRTVNSVAPDANGNVTVAGGGGGSTDTSILTAVIKESGGSYPARPSGYANVKFIGATDPGTAAQNGDEWVKLT
jgi:hypothetical protein